MHFVFLMLVMVAPPPSHDICGPVSWKPPNGGRPAPNPLWWDVVRVLAVAATPAPDREQVRTYFDRLEDFRRTGGEWRLIWRVSGPSEDYLPPRIRLGPGAKGRPPAALALPEHYPGPNDGPHAATLSDTKPK